MVIGSRYAVFKDQTPTLAGTRSLQSPKALKTEQQLLEAAGKEPNAEIGRNILERNTSTASKSSSRYIAGVRSVGCYQPNLLPRKEVIQPHLQVRLPCYDFTPIASPTFVDRAPQGVRCAYFGYCQLSWCDGRCVQGPGTYSPRHSDPRLLATPPSRSRVADCDPNLDAL